MCIKSTVLVKSKPCCTSGPAVRAMVMFLFHLQNAEKWPRKKNGEAFFQAVHSSVNSRVFKKISPRIVDLNMKGKTKKPLEENTEHLHDPAITKI